MSVLVIAEKPSVARDLAAVLGARTRREGYLAGDRYLVTWAFGHLVELCEPHEIRNEWKQWRPELLPMLPDRWPLRVGHRHAQQFKVVKELLHSRQVQRIVCATDAGREGELIFRYILEACQCRKPSQRLWISSLTPEAIARGFAQLRPSSDFDGLAAAARARSRADWLVGMNASRAYSLALGDTLSVGRVQTPTLAMLVERELSIRNFVPEHYLEVSAEFRTASQANYRGTWFDPALSRRKPTPPSERQTVEPAEEGPKDQRLPTDGRRAKAIVDRVQHGRATVENHESRERKLPPPRLYDLTELQRQANRRFGFTADRTLNIAQALYERHKAISYPRTESRCLDADTAGTLANIVAGIRKAYSDTPLQPDTGERALGRRFVDDDQVGDHHAIIPTTKRVELERLSRDEARVYDMICRRLLAAWQNDHRYGATVVVTAVESGTGKQRVIDRFRSRGTQVLEAGWKAIDAPPPTRRAQSKQLGLPEGLSRGVSVDVHKADIHRRSTKPPRRHDDGTLLTAMEHAGRRLEDKALGRAMADNGLGTPATRASIIETLLRRAYVVREGKSLAATQKGIDLIEAVHAQVKTPAMTAEWERELQNMERGRGELAEFMRRIENYVSDLVACTHGLAPNPVHTPRPELSTPPKRPPAAAGAEVAQAEFHATPPARHRQCAQLELDEILSQVFGHSQFRSRQATVCRAITRGADSLVVMPTGAGKSLCYQLPGLARGGTTLVVSPLIALIEDQVNQLRARGLAAERIHSGLEREQARSICRGYLDGKLDYLFVAPERLGVPGFPEMLAKRPPGLIAIDEAHCISEWGHDFRPDYRKLEARLQCLRPTPIVALTATATPRVQKDILKQLGLKSAESFIHGFRRSNIAIEVAEVPAGQRDQLVLELLQTAELRPAIVYAPSRKRADELAATLAAEHAAAAYHAGLSKDQRSSIQHQFTEGKLDTIVATIAFGMGIDKANVRSVIHVARPASVENYYQEIGRAGRDGQPSRALLLHSFADRRTHEYFLDRDYPEVEKLERCFRALPRQPCERRELAAQLQLETEALDRYLDKLWVHGGAIVHPQQQVSRGHGRWRKPYERQRAHKRNQLDQLQHYLEDDDCRMRALVRYFGDRGDTGEPCGHCDRCAPSNCTLTQEAKPSKLQRRALQQIVEALLRRDGIGVARLRSEVFNESMSRDELSLLLEGLKSAKIVVEEQRTFEKSGETIKFRALCLRDPPTAEAQVPLVRLRQASIMRKRSTTQQAPRKRRTSDKPSRRRATMGLRRPGRKRSSSR